MLTPLYYTETQHVLQIQTYTIKFPGPGSVVDDDSVKLEIWNVVDNADAPTLQQQSQHQGSGSAANPNRIALDAQSVDVYHDTHACLFMMDPRSKSGLDYISHILPDVRSTSCHGSVFQNIIVSSSLHSTPPPLSGPHGCLCFDYNVL